MVSTKEFGKIFRDSREEKGFSVEEASGQSKIHARVIVDIESGVFDRLGAVYVKSFVKKYAEFLGLNTPDILKIFEHITRPKPDFTKADEFDLGAGPSAGGGSMRTEHLQKPSGTPVQTSITPNIPISRPDLKFMRFGTIINIIIPIAVIVFIFLFVGSLRSSGPKREDKLMQDFAEKQKGIRSGDKEALSTSDKTTPEKKQSVSQKKDEAKLTFQEEKLLDKEIAVTPKAVQEIPKSSEAKDEQLTVKLKARGEVWIQVFDAGKTVYVGTLQRGDEKILKTDGALMVWTGKGEYLDFDVNGVFLGKAADGVIRNIKVSREGISIGDKWVKRVK